MHIPPQRRTRILEAHRLRRRGRSLRKIGEQLDVSPATIHADLQLLESNWPDIASPTAQDAMLEQLTRLRALADQLMTDGPLAPLTRLGYEDNGRHVTLFDRFVTKHPQLITDLHRIHYHAIAAVARELRLTADRILAAARTEDADIDDIDDIDDIEANEAAEAAVAAHEAIPEPGEQHTPIPEQPVATPQTLPESAPAAARSITPTDPHQTSLNGSDHLAPTPPDTEPAPLSEEAQFLGQLITDFPGAPEEHQQLLKELEAQLVELGHLPTIPVPTPQ